MEYPNKTNLPQGQLCFTAATNVLHQWKDCYRATSALWIKISALKSPELSLAPRRESYCFKQFDLLN